MAIPARSTSQPQLSDGSLIARKLTVTLYTQDDPLVLESGRTLGPVKVAYETLGRLNANRDNAILICHALTGDSHVAGRYSPEDAKPGWWDGGVGPGRAFDTDRYFIICANVLGGCAGTTGPAEINPATGRPYGLDFPVITPRDMVRVQARLLDHLGIRRVLAVAGGSLGGMQALEWAVTYPDRVLGVIPLASASRFHPQGIAWNQVQRQAILNDPEFKGGQYYPGPGPVKGLALARMLGMITYRSDESMWAQFGRNLRPADQLNLHAAQWDDGYGGRPAGARAPAVSPSAAGASAQAAADPGDRDLDRGFGIAYEVESYLDYNGGALVRRFDANSYLYLSRAMDLHDLGRGYPSLAAAHARITAEALVIGIRTDLLFPPYLQQETVRLIQQAGGHAEYLEMNSPWGHDAFLVDFDLVAGAIADFLARQERRARRG